MADKEPEQLQRELLLYWLRALEDTVKLLVDVSNI